jgi:DNA repair ATPase RecN
MKIDRGFMIPGRICGSILIITVIILAGCGGGGTKTKLLYIEKARGLGDIIMKQAEASLNICRMYDTVWEYAKVSDMDFGTAYREMGGRADGVRLDMEANKARMTVMLSTLESPPKGFEKLHERLMELWDMYKQFEAFVAKIPDVSQEEYHDEVDIFVSDLNDIRTELQDLITAAQNLQKP